MSVLEGSENVMSFAYDLAVTGGGGGYLLLVFVVVYYSVLFLLQHLFL